MKSFFVHSQKFSAIRYDLPYFFYRAHCTPLLALITVFYLPIDNFCMFTCSIINPDVEIEVHKYNITTVDNFSHFMDRLRYIPIA